MTAEIPHLDNFRVTVRQWCTEHVPIGWRQAQTGATHEEYVTFQQSWFQELRTANYAVPHWPKEWGGGLSMAEQVILHQELAAHDAPRLVLAFVAIHHAASTLLYAGTDEQRQRYLPSILEGEIWCQGFSEPEAGSDLASLKTTAERVGDSYIVNGQKLWSSYAIEADWCLLLARTNVHAPKRRGISYFLMDMNSPGIELRSIRQATGESHFCEMFLDDVEIPVAQLVGEENAGWDVAQSTLSAERGMTMLELAERLGHAGLGRLVATCLRSPSVLSQSDGGLSILNRLAELEIEVNGLRQLCRGMVEENGARTPGNVDASIAKLFYSELLQRMTDFGVEVEGLEAQTALQRPLSSSFESGTWALDFIGSWEWTIPGGTSEIQRSIIGERGLGLPREPVVA
jgi:alkylation response protein AidB-like acyl-CoA dehydrogenase